MTRVEWPVCRHFAHSSTPTLFETICKYEAAIIPPCEGPSLLEKHPLIGAGCLSLTASLVRLGLLDWSSSVEQARSPGEKGFGVAVLGMIFGLPALLFGLVGALCLLAGICVWAFRANFKPNGT
jgi:hypothetical protein